MRLKLFRRFAAFAAAVALLVTASAGSGSAALAGSDSGAQGIARAIAAQEAHTAALFGIEGVVGTGVGLDGAGNAVVVVFTDVPGIGGIPSQVDGVSTSVRVSGPFVALPRGGNGGGKGKDKNQAPIVTITEPTDGFNFPLGSSVTFAGTANDSEDGVLTVSISWTVNGSGAGSGSGGSTGPLTNGSYTIEASVTDFGGKTGSDSVTISVGDPPPEPFDTKAQHRPAPIGVSTGHPDITAGTLGARVTNGTNVYALSNNHVYADVNAASIGDSVLQPGTFDGGTVANDTIGTLAAYVELKFNGSANTVDAAIALVSADTVGNSTPPGEGYGTPSSATAAAYIGQPVQKYGRTTGLTTGAVNAISVNAQVCYGQIKGRVCFGGLANFTGQIIVTDNGEKVGGGTFSAGGDSGSLIVTNDANNNPVGLLYAGSSTYTLANPIDAVLAELSSSQPEMGTLTIDGS